MRKLGLRWMVFLFAAAAIASSVLYILPLYAAVPSEIPAVYFSVPDSGGANNGPGQKDLTQMGWYEDPGADQAPNTTDDILDMVWSWDDITVNGNNTLDACALFDSDDDTFINVAICGTVQKVNGPNGGMHLKGTATVYTCSDAKADRCTNPLLQPAPTASQVVAGGLAVDGNGNLLPIPNNPYHLVTDTDPFPTGDASPQDTTIRMRVARAYLDGLGGPLDPALTNVCSYPSQQPNSDPSDCNNPPGGGFLKIVKDADPDSETVFDFKVTSFPNPAVADAYPCPAGTPCDASAKDPTGTANDVSAQLAVLVGTVDIEELAETNWSLTGVACVFQGDGTANGSLDGTTYKAAQIKSGLITVCTFTNKRDSGTITVRKSLPIATADTFTLSISGGVGSQSVGGGGSLTVQNVPTGTYTLSETADAPASLAAYNTTWSCTIDGVANAASGTGASTDTLTLTTNGTIDCTFTNALKQGTLIVKKVVDNTQNPSSTPKVAKDFSFTVNGGQPISFPDNNADGDNNALTATAAAISVAPGTTVNVAEVLVTGYTPSYAAVPGSNTCTGLTIAGGATVTCTITNTADKTSPGKTTQQSWIIKDTITFTGNPPKIGDGGAVVHFRLYSANTCAPATLVGDNLNMAINASGIATTATGVAVSTPGKYWWRVEYTGNSFYNGFTTGCTTAGEEESTQIIALDNVNTP